MKREKKRKKNKKEPSSLLWQGQLWFFFFANCIWFLQGTVFASEFHPFQNIWPYLITACGSIPVTIIFLIEPHNPFWGNSTVFRPIDIWSIEERKALTFLKTNPKMKSLIFQTGIILFLSPFLMPFIQSHFFVDKDRMDISWPLVTAVLHLFYSLMIQIFVTNRYLLKHWDEISEMDIEPWPLEKPYARGSQKYQRKIGEPTFWSELDELSKQNFNWPDFFILLLGILAFLLMMFGFHQDPFKRTLDFVAGLLLLGIATFLLNIRKNKKNKK